MLLCVFYYGCKSPEWDYRLQIKNNSNLDIYVKSAENYVPINDTTRVYMNYWPVNMPDEYKVFSLNSICYRVTSPWEKVFKYRNTDTVTFYIFNANILENTSWDEVRSKYLVLQKYNISLKDFEFLNWVITYPPAEEMKDIKMYPPYGK